MCNQFRFLSIFLLTCTVPALMAASQESPDDVIAVRDKLNKTFHAAENSEDKDTIKKRLSALADVWLFSSDVLPGDKLCETYTVKSGETLSKIGQRYKVPYEILLEINKIKDAKSLQAGQKIKVINGPFHAKIQRSTFTLDLFLQETFVNSFTVCIGKQDTPTPTGLWRVEPKGKMIKPPWYDEYENKTYLPDDPEYPLGPRWIGLEGLEGDAKGRSGFAIHGNNEPETIGTAASRGCVRMRNDDVVLIYNLLFPAESKVEIKN